jgi:hypothetical protein
MTSGNTMPALPPGPFLTEGWLYTWRVTFADGSELREFSADGSANRFPGELDREIRLVSWDPVDPLYREVSVDVPPGAKAVMFRRNVWMLSSGERYFAYALGYEAAVETPAGRRTTKHLTYFTPAFSATVQAGGEFFLVRFPGAVEYSEDPNFVVAVDRWRTGLEQRLIAARAQEAARGDRHADG